MIQCEPRSVVPHFSRTEMDEMKLMLSGDIPEFEFDPEYEKHVPVFNGGRPIAKYFRGAPPIDFLLNYSDTDLLSEPYLQELNANVFWSLIDDQLGPFLLPFAVTGGGDVFCFDYERGVPPEVVIWYHEISGAEGIKVKRLARSFAEFAQGL